MGKYNLRPIVKGLPMYINWLILILILAYILQN
jgi:hypothetical protein